MSKPAIAEDRGVSWRADALTGRKVIAAGASDAVRCRPGRGMWTGWNLAIRDADAVPRSFAPPKIESG